MKRRSPLLVLIAAVLAAPLTAQDYEWDRVDEAGVEFLVYKRLERLPLRLGDGDGYLVARYEPLEPGDHINVKHGASPWGLKVLQFKKGTAKPEPAAQPPPEKPPAAGKEATTAVAEREKDEIARSFSEWVNGKGKGPSQRFVVQAKAFKRNKAKGSNKLGYEWWEYTNETPMTNGYESFQQLVYNYAAVYDFEDRIVTLVCDVPVRKGNEPESKHRGWAQRMLESVTVLGEGEDAELTDAKKEQYADTEAKKKALEAAKANIADMLGKGWDYFTTPSYIVLYSWDADKSDADKQMKQRKKATDLAAALEEMRKLYEQAYPPHDKMGNPYSVLRILFSKDQFDSYGSTGGGVVGWFSPQTKELVIFTGDVVLGPGATKAIAFHEGWHQYCDSFFGTELHRWFDEGTGDFFGSYDLQGRGRWKYDNSKMRRETLRRLLNDETWVPFSEIVTWNKDKFYGPRTTDFYAQGYAMVDFLRRGPEKLGRRWDESWTGILERYCEVARATKDQKKALEAAFKDVDWDKMQKAWVEWVKKELL